MEERYYHLQNSRIKEAKKETFLLPYFRILFGDRSLCVKFLLFSYGDV